MVKKLLVVAAAVVIASSPAMAKSFTSWSSGPATSTYAADVVLEWDGGVFYGYGTSPNWTDNTVVEFEAPAGGPWALTEAHYYMTGATARAAEVWNAPLGPPPVSVAQNSIDFTPNSGGLWPPVNGWTIVDISSYGVQYNAGDTFGIGTVLLGAADANGTDGLGLAYATDDANPGYSWALWQGAWTDDTNNYNTDDGIRAGLNMAGGTPTVESSWSGIKGVYAQ